MRFLRRVWLIILVLKGLIKMANTIADSVQALTDQVTATEGVEASAIAYVQGVPALIQAAVDAATTLPDLQAKLTDLQARLVKSAAEVAAAVAAAPQAAPPVVVPPVTPGPAIATAPVTVTGTGTVSDPGNGQA